MKRSHIQALTSALDGRAATVASLHVLSQPVLDDDDHAFLVEIAHKLPFLDLLRWLARCPPEGPRARIIAALAAIAERQPRRFEGEVLGASLPFLQEDDWAELYDRVRPWAPPRLSRRVLEKTSGSAVYRALLGGARQALAPEAEFFPQAYDLLPRDPSERAVRAFGDEASVELARRLFAVRNDERACVAALREAIASSPARGASLWAAAEAGLLGRLGPAAAELLPGETRFGCEGERDEALAAQDGAVRWLACTALGEGGAAWLAAQVDAALGRGAPLSGVLEELNEAARRAVWERSREVRGRVASELAGADAERLDALRRVLPWAVSEEEALGRRLFGPGAPGVSAERLMEAARERARGTMDGRECAALLGWMERREVSRRALFELAAAAVRRGVGGLDLLAWLSRRLVSRSSWEQHGAAVLSALLDQGAFSELAELFAQSWSEAGGAHRPLREDEAPDPQEGSSPPGFREAAHAAFACALAQQARAAIAAGDEARALRALSALPCLDPPARLNPILHELARSAGASGAARELIEVNASLVRHGGRREATLHGLISAIHVLAGG